MNKKKSAKRRNDIKKLLSITAIINVTIGSYFFLKSQQNTAS